MSGTPQLPADNNDAGQHADETDHDLLTFGEAGRRLRAGIDTTTTLLEDAEARGDIAKVAEARRRLAALHQAAYRNSAHPSNDVNFEKFFGFTGNFGHGLPKHAPE